MVHEEIKMTTTEYQPKRKERIYDQRRKCIRRMPWQSEAKKDVIACEKLRGVGK